MRIAFVVHGYPPQDCAGVELVAGEQARALAARGHSVHVFARAYGAATAPVEERDGEVFVRFASPVDGAGATRA